MKIKVDENLPSSIVRELRRLGHDADSVHDEGLQGWSDEQLWPEVVRVGRFLITQDVRFADARRSLAEGSPGVLLLRIHDEDFEIVLRRLVEVYKSENVESWSGCSVTVTLSSVRVRRPGGEEQQREGRLP